MISWQKWVEGPDVFPLAWEAFLSSDAGKAGLEVLANRMVQEARGNHANASLIESKAIVGAEDDGYRKCFNYLNQLRFPATDAAKKQLEKMRAAQTPEEGTKLPGVVSPREKVMQDPIIKEHLRRQQEAEQKTQTP